MIKHKQLEFYYKQILTFVKKTINFFCRTPQIHIIVNSQLTIVDHNTI